MRNDANTPDNRRRRDRAPVRLVVERDVPGDDRNPERLGRLRELPADLRLLGIAEVQTVGQRERLAPGAGDVARRLEHRCRSGRERVELADRRPVERDREAAIGRKETQHRRIEPRTSHRPRLNHVVVLFVDPRFRLVIRCRGRPLRGQWLRFLLELVARAFVRQERGGDGTFEIAAVEASKLAGVADLADHGVVELPLVEHRFDRVQPHRLDDGYHPLLTLGNHDLPRLEIVLTHRHAVEVDVDAGAVAGHLGQRRSEPGGAAVLEGGNEPGVDELERGFDQLLASKRIADLHRRPLLLGTLSELLAREYAGTADSVATRRGAVEGDRPCTHRDDVAQDPADARRGALERLDCARVVVALDLERDHEPLAEVDDARVLAGPLQDSLAFGRQPLEQQRRMLVAAVLGPQQREDRELEAIRLPAEQVADPGELAVRQPEGAMKRLFRYRRQSPEFSRLTGRAVDTFLCLWPPSVVPRADFRRPGSDGRSGRAATASRSASQATDDGDGSLWFQA